MYVRPLVNPLGSAVLKTPDCMLERNGLRQGIHEVAMLRLTTTLKHKLTMSSLNGAYFVLCRGYRDIQNKNQCSGQLTVSR